MRRAFAFASFALAVACVTNTTTTGLTPITGIVVRSDSLTTGHGCGTGDQQVYKYAVIVSTVGSDAGAPLLVAGNVNDCFSDATFANLCASASGSFAYQLQVYAYDAAAWAAATQDPATSGLLLPVSVAGQVTSSGLSNLPSVCSSPAPPDPPYSAPTAALLATHASWTTTCTAQQQSSIEVLAVCGPLQ